MFKKFVNKSRPDGQEAALKQQVVKNKLLILAT
jgi:hypothetical protein